MSSKIIAGTTSGTALNMSADTSGILEIQTGSGPTTAITVDASQNVGIGTASPAAKLDVSGSGTNASALIQATRSDLSITTAMGSDGGLSGGFVRTVTNNPLVLGTNNTERMRIDSSGNLLVGTTSYLSSTARVTTLTSGDGFKTQIGNGAAGFIVGNTSGTGSYNAQLFYNNNFSSLVGYISISGTTASYVSTSDYRLKENVLPMTGGLEKVAKLKPVTYSWKSDGSAGQGFIAHELAEVCPDAVSGEKDAVNKDGSIKPQGIDTSFLVATLTAALQELNSKVTALETQLGAK